MTANSEPQEEGHASDIISTNKYEPELPKKKDFLPWHKPRKQFVRQEQWCEQINKLIEEVLPENNVLKYLGLPGDDLLDLRYFHRIICEPKNIRLCFLGFNIGARSSSNQGAELNISLDEVNKLPLVDPASDIIGDNIFEIANVDSLAWERFKKIGPYEVVNIDLCDGFGNHPQGQLVNNHYNALRQIMTLQARRANPWLLLLTTRTGPQHTDGETFGLLKDLYGKNLLECPDFLEASNTHFSISDNASLNTATASPKGNSDIFLVSLCKWITTIALSQNPPAKIELKSAIGYKVDNAVGHLDLVSLAIKIDPTLLVIEVDGTGLANQQQQAPNECRIAVQILNRVSRLLDADNILSSSPALLSEMITATSNLLEEARYDISGFPAWAQQM